MKASEIGFELLNSVLTKQHDKETIKRVEMFLFNQSDEDNLSGDCALVFGSPDCTKYRSVHAIELYREKRVNCILFSGGVVLPETEVFEAQAMARQAIEKNIPQEDILIETKSKYTHENVIYSREILKEKYTESPTILLVTSPVHMRRVHLNMQAYMSDESQWICSACDDNFARRDNWYSNAIGVSEVARELHSVTSYILKGYLPDFDVDF